MTNLPKKIHKHPMAGYSINRQELLDRYAAGERDFYGIILIGVDLSSVHLSGIDFSRGQLMGVKFAKADLSETNLSEANLSEANLEWANLFGAFLSGADWEMLPSMRPI